jgi:hypothetical protein
MMMMMMILRIIHLCLLTSKRKSLQAFSFLQAELPNAFMPLLCHLWHMDKIILLYLKFSGKYNCNKFKFSVTFA